MFNFEKVGNSIETLEQKIKNLEEKPSTNEAGYWQKLSVYCQNMSADQLNFINSNKKVIEKQKKMMDAFNLFLFEKHKEEFAQIEQLKPLCEEYINAILSASDDYADVLKITKQENEELKKKILELERKQNDRSNTKRA